MFWKWGGNDIKIYGRGVIEGQGQVSHEIQARFKCLTRLAVNDGGMSLIVVLDRESLTNIQFHPGTELNCSFTQYPKS